MTDQEERAYFDKLDADRVAQLTPEEREAVIKAYGGHGILPLSHVPRKHGERLRGLGMAVSYEVDGWFRRYKQYGLSIFGGEVARRLRAEMQAKEPS